MNIPGLLQHLGVSQTKPAGQELLCPCPECNSKDSLSVNKDTGQWQCFHGCGKGNAWTLVPHYLPDLKDAKPRIMQVLKDTGNADEFQQVNQAWDQEKQARKAARHDEQVAKYRAYASKLIEASDDAIARVAKAKDLDEDLLRRFGPLMHKNVPHLALPVHNPAKMQGGPVGCLRVHLDGEDIRTRNGEVAKYPSIGTMGLYAIKWLVKQDKTEPIIFTEGWRDVMAAWSLGLQATCCNLGAGKWYDGFERIFEHREVWIVLDQDSAGVKGAKKLAEHLHEHAQCVRIVTLPYEYQDKGGDDLRDYVVRDGHTREELEVLCRKADPYTPVTAPEGSVELPDDFPDTVAAAFEADSKYKHRYHPDDDWSMFKNGQYQEINDETQLQRYISKFMSRCVTKKTIKKEDCWVRIPLNNSKIKDVTKQVSFLDGVYLLPSQSDPCSLDGKLDHRHIIPMQNGLLDWSTWPPVLHPPSDKYYTRTYLPYPWKGEAHSDLWGKFLASVTRGDQEIEELLQMWAGYCLTKERGQQKFMIAYGEAGTGKSVYMSVLTSMLGAENVSSVNLDDFNDPNALYSTYGKMLNACDETSKQLEDGIENIVKGYVSGGKVSFKKLWSDRFDALPTAKLLIATNHLPKFKDTSNGVWRRIILAPFDYVIPEDEIVLALEDKIAATELPSVLYWALKGAVKLQKRGRFPLPDRCARALDQYKKDCVPELEFLEENFEECSPDLNAFAVPQTQFRSFYKTFCECQGIGIKSTKHLMESAKKMFPGITSKPIRRGGKLVKCWAGIAMKNGSEFYEEWATNNG